MFSRCLGSARSAVATAGASRWHSTPAADVALRKVPSLPVVGSLFSPWSGLPPIDRDDIINWGRKTHKDNGPFYSMGFPGLGGGSHGLLHVVRDPNEMLKVLKREGSYPSGFVEKEWPLFGWWEKRGYTKGIFSRGAEWKRIRSFLQKDLLAPVSAREYLPGILRGAARASTRAAGVEAGDINRYLNFSAFDKFMEVLIGGEAGMSREEYDNFCSSCVEGLSLIFDTIRSPAENVAHRMGIETPQIRRIHGLFDVIDDIAMRRLRGFMEQVERDELTPEERNSYFYKLMKRLPESDVTENEMLQCALVVMVAAVDTTAAKVGWNILQLSLHQDVQQRLHEEIQLAVQREGGLTASVFDDLKKNVPLLPAVIRETHRCTPTLMGDIVKTLAEPTEVHGVELAKGSVIMFDSLTHLMDPDLVEDPLAYRPERWFKGAVAERKGTSLQIIDHPFFGGPFSQGARRCPGSRVANLEVEAMLASILLEYRIEGPEDGHPVHWADIKGELQTLFVPQFPDFVKFVPR